MGAMENDDAPITRRRGNYYSAGNKRNHYLIITQKKNDTKQNINNETNKKEINVYGDSGNWTNYIHGRWSAAKKNRGKNNTQKITCTYKCYE